MILRKNWCESESRERVDGKTVRVSKNQVKRSDDLKKLNYEYANI